jgi:hypothetical protein
MKKFRGLGDLVAFVVYPVAFVLRRLGFRVGEDTPNPQNVPEAIVAPPNANKGCGCKQRQQKLNEFLPFSKNP